MKYFSTFSLELNKIESCIETKVVSLSTLYFYLLGISIFKKDALLFINKYMYVPAPESIF